MNQLFPQPTLTSGVGINMSGFAVGASHIACMGGGFFTAVATEKLTAGTYRISGEGLREDVPVTVRVGISTITGTQGANGTIAPGEGPFELDIVVTHDPDDSHQSIGVLASAAVDFSEFSCVKVLPE